MNGAPQVGPALAVGHMNLPGDQIGSAGKGKAVNIVHIWKDHLWEIGGKEDPPAPRVIELNQKSGFDVDGEGLPSDNPDSVIETMSERPGEGSQKTLDNHPPAVSLKEGPNPLSQQGISLSGVVTIS